MFLSPFLVLSGFASGFSGCLPDAIPESARKDLVNGAETYGVGLWVNDWPAGHAAAALVKIVIQEVLGFNVEQKGVGASTPFGFFAIAGCVAPHNSSDRMCGASTTYVHINVEAWSGGYQTLLAEMEAEMPFMVPKSLGSMGYGGLVSMYIPEQVKNAAYNADGEALEYFRSYNVSKRTAWRYFNSPGDVETSRLRPCTETTLTDSPRMKEYAELSGDTEGVVVKGNLTEGRCFDRYFWYAPGCRQDPATCVVLFSGGTGWGLFEFMQKATAHHMPLAIAVAATWGDYTTLPQDYSCLTYWWEPDPTHLALNPSRLIFPVHDAEAFSRGDVSSQTSDVEISKQVSQDLGRLAPDVEALLSNLKIDMKSMKSLLRDQLDSQDEWSEVACRWLQANSPRWKQWIPDNSECSPGFGMFDEQEERFVSDRPDPISIRCRPCPAGQASELLRDGRGTTHVCRQCPPGTHQAAGWALSCDPCPAGEFQNEQGKATCKRCPIGLYQDEVGQQACKSCPESSTTVGLGSRSISECGCKPDTINVLESTTSFQCLRCSRGLHCPLSSSITSLRKGEAVLGEAYTPKVLRGFYSTREAPLNVWECRPPSACPGGMPGECEGGLEAVPCSSCPRGQTLVEGVCQDCSGGAFIPFLVAIPLGLAGLTQAYYILNKPVSARTSPFTAVLLSAAFTVIVLQVVAIFGMMTLQWSDDFEATSGALQIFMLDLQALHPGCVLGQTALASFLLRTLVFPTAALWLVVCYGVSLLRYPWKLPRVFNTIGTLFSAGFGTMSAVAMQPLMCYQHPNGQQSLLKYPNVVCGSPEHSGMLASGVALGSLAIGFFSACLLAAWRLPAWSQRSGHLLQAFRFLYGNFRQSAWWFGLLPLIRGFGFAFAIVVAINLPAAQVAIASVLLLAYVLAQASLKPWKARLINQMDMLLSASLLLLIRTSMQEDREKEESFARAWTLITLFFLSFCLTFMFLVSFLALLAQWRGRDAIRVLNMESIHAEEELRALKSCAEALLQVETDQLLLGMKKINAYDLKQISTTIEIMDDLLGTKFSSGSSRLRLSGANERYTAQFPGGVEAEQAASEAEDQTAQESNADELVKDDVEDIVKTEC